MHGYGSDYAVGLLISAFMMPEQDLPKTEESEFCLPDLSSVGVDLVHLS